ncbi:OmpA family protein [Fusibacter tunisiensis]|uniref:Outer membrane protein OmpA-like peptidoglycan-associated protein n=1 Tax=Fusibacter tunisiensis TaxID=1008308 RepID=A0ABS2MNM0_9FIRM|nr:OmpA family protein [Fusibacter tunisiensis]MBM7560989.1 outer membrane protein OmpA-like peptidoglycan-associated protein [Fusibacter tunisiensis]
MSAYRLTTRGKYVLVIFVIVLIFNLVYSTSLLVDHFGHKDDGRQLATQNSDETEPISTGETDSVPESVAPTEAPTESPTEAPTETPTTEASMQESDLYTQEILEDLRATLFEFNFITNTVDLKPSDEGLWRDLIEVLKAYPDEAIIIEGHVNGYPDFKQTDAALQLSEDRSEVILNQLLDAGIEIERINVYNFGSEVPKFRESAKQTENDRVLVYFKDHYTSGMFK